MIGKLPFSKYNLWYNHTNKIFVYGRSFAPANMIKIVLILSDVTRATNYWNNNLYIEYISVHAINQIALPKKEF